jgi:hypothetical protein
VLPRDSAPFPHAAARGLGDDVQEREADVCAPRGSVCGGRMRLRGTTRPGVPQYPTPGRPPSPTGRRAAGVPRRAGILPSCRGDGHSLLAASAPPSLSFGMAASPDRSAGASLSGSCPSQGRSTRPCCCSSAESFGSFTATASPTPGSGPRCRRPPLLTCAECGSQSDEKATGWEARAGQAYVIEPGHDAWVVGDEAVVGFEFDSRTAEEYAKG